MIVKAKEETCDQNSLSMGVREVGMGLKNEKPRAMNVV